MNHSKLCQLAGSYLGKSLNIQKAWVMYSVHKWNLIPVIRAKATSTCQARDCEWTKRVLKDLICYVILQNKQTKKACWKSGLMEIFLTPWVFKNECIDVWYTAKHDLDRIHVGKFWWVLISTYTPCRPALRDFPTTVVPLFSVNKQFSSQAFA